MSWFMRRLRSGKEFAGAPTAPERVKPLQAAATFKLKECLKVAEDINIAYLLSPDERRSPSPAPPSAHPTPLTNQSPGKAASKRKDPPEEIKEGGSSNYRHAKRRRKREQTVYESGHAPRPGSTSSLLAGTSASAIASDVDIHAFPAAHGGYFAKPQRKEDQDLDYDKEYTLEELKALGFTYIAWDGVTPIPLYDEHGVIFAVLAGRPSDPSYVDDADKAFELMATIGDEEVWSDKEVERHRRGFFIAHNVGVTAGKGQPGPLRLNTGTHAVITERLLGNRSIKRLATFASSAFQRWSPKLFDYYKDHMDALYAHDPSLGRNFSKSVFPCTAFNLSRRSWSFKHRDSANLPFGWCAICALAKKGFRPHLGGQIILWELRMVVEFPHAATIFIPSACVTHSNVPPAKGDERLSFTQFAAGALFRYVDNGFQNDKQLFNRNRAEFCRMDALKSTRWEKGLALYSTLEELLEQSN